MLKEQCNDEYLTQCELKRVRADDGTIEFVSDATREQFQREGAKCLVWRNIKAPPPPPMVVARSAGGESSAALATGVSAALESMSGAE